MESIEGDQLRGHLETMVLSALSQGAAHGFEIIKRLQESGCGALQLKEGTVYPVLYRLEQAKLICGSWEDNKRRGRGPRRRIYRLVPRGRRNLEERRAHWRHFVNIIGSIVEAKPCSA